MFSLRKLAKLVNLDKMRLIRLKRQLPSDLVELNLQLALQQPHYQPIYSIQELATLMEVSKYKALQHIKRCQITLYQMGHKRIIFLSDLDKLNRQGDWTKHSAVDSSKWQ